MHPIDLVLSENPLKDCDHGLAHQSLAPVSLRQVERQLRPAVGLRPLVETASADKLIIVRESDAPLGQLTRGQRLRDRSIIASTIGTDGMG